MLLDDGSLVYSIGGGVRSCTLGNNAGNDMCAGVEVGCTLGDVAASVGVLCSGIN